MLGIGNLMGKVKKAAEYKKLKSFFFWISIGIFIISFVTLLANFSCHTFPFGKAIFRCDSWLSTGSFNATFVTACATLLSASGLMATNLKQ